MARVSIYLPKRERRNRIIIVSDLFPGMKTLWLQYDFAKKLLEQLLASFRSAKEIYVYPDKGSVRLALFIKGIMPDVEIDSRDDLSSILFLLEKGKSRYACDMKTIEEYCHEKCEEECEMECYDGYEDCFYWCKVERLEKCKTDRELSFSM